MTSFLTGKDLHGINIHGTPISWNDLIKQADHRTFPSLIQATPTVETILAIFNAMRHEKMIALIDPSTPASFQHCIQLKLDRFLQQQDSHSFGIVLLTSGTTGTPKMLLLREEALYYSALGAVDFFKIDTSSHLPLSLPLSHVSGLGLFFRALLADATLHLFDGNLTSAFNFIKNQVTHLSLVRTQANRLIDNHLLDDSPQLACVLLGGSSFPADLLKKLERYPFMSYLSYGMSETSSVVWAYSLKEHIGKVLPYRKLSSYKGKIAVGGKTLFEGYIEEDGTLSSPFTNTHLDRLFETSDQGHFDESTQMLTLFGRSDDIFLFGGENISIKELEESLLKIAGVTIAMVMPLPSTSYGHVPLAILATSLTLDLSEWRKKFLTVLPKVKMPKVVVTLENFVEDAPDAKQQLSKLKKQVIGKLAMFEDLQEENRVQKWSL